MMLTTSATEDSQLDTLPQSLVTLREAIAVSSSNFQCSFFILGYAFVGKGRFLKPSNALS